VIPSTLHSRNSGDSATRPAVVSTITEVRDRVAGARAGAGATVGLVPTMGSFHEGHLSLMRAARRESDFVIVSIFVNPAQFAPGEDLENYPRDPERDRQLAAGEGVDLLFIPETAEIYPEGFETFVEPGSVAEGLCGRNRPGHFRGVATVVAKLFNIIGPDRAYFGQKDAQQAAVVRRMAADLDFAVEVKVCPTVREQDGLAMSSRNVYLTDEERAQAPLVYQALVAAREALAGGQRDASKLRRLMRRAIGQNYMVELEYARIVDPVTMQSVQIVEGEVLAAIAARIGKARLIDNMLIAP